MILININNNKMKMIKKIIKIKYNLSKKDKMKSKLKM